MFYMRSLALLVLSLPCAAAELQVLSKTPAGRSQSGVPAVTVSFNQPMVALTDPAKMGEFCPLELEPSVKGRCRWMGTQVLSFEPERPLKPATLFKARVPAGTKSQVSGEALAAEAEWEFETLRPQLVDSRPRDKDRWIALGATMLVRFNADMDPRRAREGLALLESGLDSAESREVSLGVRRATAEEIKSAWPYDWSLPKASTANVLAVKPSRLQPDRAYRLVLREGLRAAEGELGLPTERAIGFETWYRFRVLEAGESGCLPHHHKLAFSNPVDPKELRAHLRVEPSTPMPAPREGENAWLDHEHRRAWLDMPELDYQPDSSYRFTIDKDLSDEFGNRLGEEYSFALNTGGYCPQMTMPEGFGLVESYLPPRHPVDAVNVQKTLLHKSLVPADQVISFYNAIKHRCDQPSVSGGFKTWDLTVARNARLRTFIDLAGPLEGRKGGFVYLEAQGPRCWERALDDVTGVGVTFKDSVDASLIWTSDLARGIPAPRVAVEIRDDANKVLWRGRTDAYGFADAPGWSALGVSRGRWERPKLWVLAHHESGPSLLSTQWRGGLEPWRFNIPYDWYPAKRRYQGTLFTERGVYRPGEVVSLKGVVRRLKDGDWAPLGSEDPKRLLLRLSDARGAEVLRTTVTVSERSSFDFAWTLREEAPTGWWRVAVTEDDPTAGALVQAVEEGEGGGDGEEEAPPTADPSEGRLALSHGFRVEAFKPASFEVKVFPGADAYVAGDTYTATVEGWYLFGAPMSGAPADWKLRLEPGSFAPPGFEGFSFSAPSDESGLMLGGASGALDERGRLALRVPTAPGRRRTMVAVLEAGAVSPERQRLFGRATTVFHPSSAYAGVRLPRLFLDKGKSLDAQVVAVAPDGAWAPGLSGTVELTRHDWLSVRRAGVAGRLEWVSEPRVTVVSTAAWTSAASTFTWTLSPSEPGEYRVRAVVRDAAGREAQAQASFYVIGSGESWWERPDHDLVELVPEKASYKPGETARILVKSPYKRAKALVTVERETVLSRSVVTVEGGASFISVKLPEKAVPNVFVGVMLVRGRLEKARWADDGDDLSKPEAKFGYAQLAVDPGGRKLAVSIKPERQMYRPGERVTARLEVSGDGGPREAEVTVFAVDEGVLALTAYATPDPFSAFYGPRPLLIGTIDSRPHVIGQRSYGEKGRNRGGGGGLGREFEGVDLRSRFVPTAFWAPSVRTGPDGKATVSFELPGNLSRFRLMAVAHEGKRFGSGESRLTSSKPLMLRTSLPRLARLGDRFEGGGVVHNYTNDGATVTLALELAGDAVRYDGEARRELFVPAGGAVETVWPMRAESTGTVKVRLRALAGAEKDGLEWPLPVTTRERVETAATSGVADEKEVEALELPSDEAARAGGLKATWSSTAMAGLQGGAKFLLEYPYGCLEQRLSRALPVVVGADLVAAFGLGDLGELKAKAQEVFDKLPQFQHPSGGYGYWPSPWLPDPYLTAYALEVSSLAAREGYRVPEASVARARDWLKGALAERRQFAYPYGEAEEYAWRAYAVQVLAMRGESLPGYAQQLFDRRDQLPYLAKAHLLKAERLLGADFQRRTLAGELLSQARVAPRSLHFEEPAETRMPWVHESTVKTTALALQALLETQGGFAGDEKAVGWLVGERKTKGRWRTTQENSAALWSLQDFYRRYEKDAPDFTATLSKEGGPELWRERFAGRSLSASTRGFSHAEVFGGGAAARLAFLKEGVGRLYYSLALSYAPASYKEPKWEGLEIERSVRPLQGEGLKAGRRAVVTITVRTKQDRTFVAVEDPLPAGLEIVDPTFAVEGREDARALAEQGERGSYWGTFHRSEKYDDRIVLFADFLTAGEHRYSYLVQATTPGRYHAPAAWAEMMYEPEVFGRTASGEVEVSR